MNIFVAKLSGNTTGDDLRQLFEAFGEVSSAKVIMDRETGNSKRFGFVEMEDDEAAQRAIDELDGSEVDGHQIVVKKARPAGENPRGARQGGGGGFRGGNSRFEGSRGQRFDSKRY